MNTGISPYCPSGTGPFRTITKALSVASPGDTIHVADGAYEGPAGESFPIVLKRGVDVVGAGAGASIIRWGTGFQPSTNTPLVRFVVNGGSSAATFTFSGFTLDGENVNPDPNDNFRGMTIKAKGGGVLDDLLVQSVEIVNCDIGILLHVEGAGSKCKPTIQMSIN